MDALPQPLTGVTVIDHGLLMAKAGARVIKVEPRHGEPLRAREAVGDGAAPLAMLNSNKRAINRREVLANEHMKGRGMLEEIDHPRLGRITVPGSPLRFHGAPQAPATPSPALGADNAEVYGELLGLRAEEVAALAREGVI